MPDPSRLRDSTQIVLPPDALDGLREDLTEEFAVTLHERDGRELVIGSPVVIDEVGDYLARQGVNVP